YPVQPVDDSIDAVVVASVDLQWINVLIGALECRPGSNVLLIGGSGTVYAADPSAVSWIGTNVSGSELMKEIGTRDLGTPRVTGFDGVRLIFGFMRDPASDTRLVVGLNEAEVLQRIDGEILTAYLQLG